MKIVHSFIANRKKLLIYSAIITLFLVSFSLGRQSVVLERTDPSSGNYSTASPELKQNSYLIGSYPTKENITGKVYRCGNSGIYHPTKTHGFFKICKAKVYELTVEQARKLGMRHCKCAG